MSAVTVNKHGYISFTLFSYYSTKIAGTIARGIVSALTDAIIKENKLLYLPISVNILKDDSIVRRVNDLQHCKIIDGRLACQPCFTFCHDLRSLHVTQELAGEAIDNYKVFLDRFTDVEDKIQLYLYENNLLEDMSWMTDEITGRRIFNEEYYEEAKKYVKDNLETY